MAKRSHQEAFPDLLLTPPPSAKKITRDSKDSKVHTWTDAMRIFETMQQLLEQMHEQEKSLIAIRVEPQMFTKGVTGIFGQQQYWDEDLESKVGYMEHYVGKLGHLCDRFGEELRQILQMQKFIAAECQVEKAKTGLRMASPFSEIGPGQALVLAKRACGEMRRT